MIDANLRLHRICPESCPANKEFKAESLKEAAPAMLAELKHLEALLSTALDIGVNIPGMATTNAIKALIAKAEGK